MTIFNNANHYLPFMIDDKLGNSERIRASDAIVSALTTAQIFDGRFVIAAAAPADTTKVWVDANTSPAITKTWNGAAWVSATFDTIWGDTADYLPLAGGTMTGPILQADGSLAAPSLAFSADPDTGLIRNGDGSIGVVSNGVLVAQFDAAGLTINGTTTTVNTTDLAVTDNEIVLNQGEAGAGVTAGTAGISIDRGSATAAVLRWNETTDVWELGLDGSEAVILSAPTNIGGGAAIYDSLSGSSPQLRTIVGGEGVTATQNATDITLAVDLSGLTAETVFDPAADLLIVYDASAAANRSFTMNEILNDVTIPAGSIV